MMSDERHNFDKFPIAFQAVTLLCSKLEGSWRVCAKKTDVTTSSEEHITEQNNIPEELQRCKMANVHRKSLISILTVSSAHLALFPFHHNPGRICSHTDRPFNTDWGISRIKGPLCSRETFVSSDRFHRASMVTGNWVWRGKFIK